MKFRRDIAAILVALLATPTTLWAAEEGGANNLFFVSPGLMIWTIIVFMILLTVLRRYAWGPILGMLEARESGIQDSLDRAAREREEAEGLLTDHRAQLAEARKEAQQIVADARATGEQVRRDIEEKARSEGQAMVESARKDIIREREEALDALRKLSVDLALAAAGKLIHEHLDDDRDRALVQTFLNSANASDKGAEA